MKDTLCIGGGHSHHQFGVNLVGFHAIIFTVQNSRKCATKGVMGGGGGEGGKHLCYTLSN